MNRKTAALSVMSLLMSTTLLACGNKASTNPSVDANSINQPVTLTFWSGSAATPDDFNKQFGDPIHKKFPNVTVKYIQKGTGTTINDLTASGTSIDIYYESIGGFSTDVQTAGFGLDMTDLAKKHNVDLTAFEPTIMDAMKKMSGGKIWGFPVWMDTMVLYYNKDIFDKFGVSYPKNGMTWDQLLELSKQLTRNIDGKQYIGLSTSPAHFLKTNSYSLSFVDPKTGQAAIDNDKWRKFIQNVWVAPAEVSGYRDVMKIYKDTIPYKDAFIKDKNLAMFAYLTNYLGNLQGAGLNWDMVSLPTFSDNSGTGSQAYPTYFGITSTSNNKDAAMEVLKYLTSEEYQMDWSKQGVISVLNNDAIKKSLGQDSPYKGKNFSAMVTNKLAPIAVLTDADNITEQVVEKQVLNQVASGSTDINSALRSAQDEANKQIAAAKQSK
ncbi:MAG: hypothetical protein JWN30_1043 [Bacilli bacterium]|nr:hypothetical protein [Bacilli bacterium]